ncbi:MAG TPA: hypothetical protein VG387_20800 [Rhizomicrobium sp.]|jgi:hypothetical protein|nr:hypothetical protein [Rhizomicrobium sp.]
MTRSHKVALFLALAIVGGVGIGLSTFFAVGHLHDGAPGMVRIVAGTLIVTFAMGWAVYFATRAHFAQDEFNREREIAASYWGGWLGIAASAPVFFFVAAGGLGHAAAPQILFTAGYLLPTICAAIGAVGARLWLRQRDGQVIKAGR